MNSTRLKVLDNHGRVEKSAHRIGDGPRDDVGDASGRKRDDERYRLCRKHLLCVRRCREERERDAAGNQRAADEPGSAPITEALKKRGSIRHVIRHVRTCAGRR